MAPMMIGVAGKGELQAPGDNIWTAVASEDGIGQAGGAVLVQFGCGGHHPGLAILLNVLQELATDVFKVLPVITGAV